MVRLKTISRSLAGDIPKSISSFLGETAAGSEIMDSREVQQEVSSFLMFIEVTQKQFFCQKNSS